MKNYTPLKRAKVAPIDFGAFSIEGLLIGHHSDGKPAYAVGVSQISELFQLDKTIATRTVKALLDGRFQLDKIATELNPKKINAVCLSGFETILRKLDRKGNLIALTQNV